MFRSKKYSRLLTVAIALCGLSFGGCSFVSDVSHVMGDSLHGLGDAVENEGRRKKGQKPAHNISGSSRRTTSYEPSSPSAGNSSPSARNFNLTYSEKTKQAQSRLQSLGYNAGGADGFYGNKTRNAVKQFQKDRDLNVTGQLDEETLTLLGVEIEATEPTQVGSNQAKATQAKSPEREEPVKTSKVKTKSTAKTAIDNTIVFAMRDPFSEIKATLNKGASVTVLEESGDWSLIQSGDVEGYAYTDDLEF